MTEVYPTPASMVREIKLMLHHVDSLLVTYLLKVLSSLIIFMRLLKSPLQIKSFLIFPSPNLFLKVVLYHLMSFISSKVLVSSYWCATDELAVFEMLTSKVLNAKLYTTELGYRDFTWKNQTPFQAFPSSVSRAVDIQGSSEALLKLPFPTYMEEVLICSPFATDICNTQSSHLHSV